MSTSSGSSLLFGIRVCADEALVDVPHQAGVSPMAPGDAVAVDLDHARATFPAA